MKRPRHRRPNPHGAALGSPSASCSSPSARFGAVDGDVLGGGVGDRVETPLSAAELDHPYRLGMGQLVVDLTRLEVEASVGVGELRVRVPTDAAVVVDAHAGMGNVSVLGADEDGLDVTVGREFPGAEATTMHLELDVGVGEVRVERGE